MKTLGAATPQPAAGRADIGPFFDFAVDRVASAPPPLSPVVTLSTGTMTMYKPTQYVPDNGSPLTPVGGTFILSNGSPPASSPYIYFGARNGSYVTSAGSVASCLYNSPVAGPVYLMPYLDARQTTINFTVTPPVVQATPPPVWANAKTFQILCPGLDGVFGYPTMVTFPILGTTPNLPLGLYNTGQNYAKESMDDITNFTTGATLQDDMAP